MKKPLLSFLLLLFCCEAFAQTIRTVSNNPTIPAQFTTLEAAVAAASAGDVLYVHPSLIAYGGSEFIVIDKPLTLIGGGYYNNDNGTFGQLETMIKKIMLTGNADNSKIANCQMNQCFFEAEEGVTTTFDNIVLEHNVITGRIELGASAANGSAVSATGLTFRNNVIARLIFENWQDFGSHFNLVVENNIIENIANGGGTGITFRNNLFMAYQIANVSITDIYSAVFLNNIFYGAQSGYAMGINNCTGCIIDFNLGFGTTDNFQSSANTVGNNNLLGDPQFTNVVNPLNNYFDIIRSSFTLQEGSIAIGSGSGDDGSGSTDMGILGGAYPYTHNELYRYPVITSLQVSNPIINSGETLQFTIKATNP